MKSSDCSASLHGFLNLHKPPGPTSQQVVAQIRRVVASKVGHCGTLDPPAAGVLPLCLGAATRLSDFLHRFPKGYEFQAVFGIDTTTLDAEGEVTARRPQPSLSRSDLESILPRFRGEVRQIPPAVSAIHYHGRRLYQLARRGEPVDPPPRTVSIHRLRLLSFHPGEFPTGRLEVLCSCGTYIRSLCRDIGEALGCPAHVSHLVRTRVGSFRLEHSISLETAVREAEDGNLQRHVIPPQRAGLGIITLCVEEDVAYEIAHGNEVTLSTPPPEAPSWPPPQNGSGARWLLVENPLGSVLALCEIVPAEVRYSPSAPAESEGETLLLRPRKVLLGAAGSASP
jgi:tRNA pseudouridine55 synthase